MRNCATTEQLPAATSWASAIANETNANTIAATNDATATVYSMVRLVRINSKVDRKLK